MAITGTVWATFADGTTAEIGKVKTDIEIVSPRQRQRDEISDAEFDEMELAIEASLA